MISVVEWRQNWYTASRGQRCREISPPKRYTYCMPPDPVVRREKIRLLFCNACTLCIRSRHLLSRAFHLFWEVFRPCHSRVVRNLCCMLHFLTPSFFFFLSCFSLFCLLATGWGHRHRGYHGVRGEGVGWRGFRRSARGRRCFRGRVSNDKDSIIVVSTPSND